MFNRSHIDRSYPAMDVEAVDVDASAGSSVMGSAGGRAQGEVQCVYEHATTYSGPPSSTTVGL